MVVTGGALYPVICLFITSVIKVTVLVGTATLKLTAEMKHKDF